MIASFQSSIQTHQSFKLNYLATKLGLFGSFYPLNVLNPCIEFSKMNMIYMLPLVNKHD